MPVTGVISPKPVEVSTVKEKYIIDRPVEPVVGSMHRTDIEGAAAGPLQQANRQAKVKAIST